jgi:crotonobetainyl-CoA:carnitine CoA-transferase CaiB-like acyl-CoA transferase
VAKAFENIKVVDFSQVLAGPFATQQLALQGAKVIKVEQRGAGDQSRVMMAPDGPLRDLGMGPIFLSVNAGKRSMTLDLKHPGAGEIVRRLVADADVFIQNFKVGAIDRLGFGYDAIRAINPSIVYCSISGYGQEGPRAKAAAYDGAIQAASGMMSMTGFAQNGPTKIGFTVVDMSTGLTAAFAISSALYRRQATGEGQFLDVSMLDCALTMLGVHVANYAATGREAVLLGNGSALLTATIDQYAARSGYVYLTAIQQNQIFALFEVLGKPALKDDPRYSSEAARLENASLLKAELEAVFRTDDAASWVEKLAAAGVPASAVLSMAQALEQPQIAHRSVLLDLPVPRGLDQPVRTAGAGFQSPDDSAGTDLPPPGIGEHTGEILAELGYDAAQIAALRADAVV